MPNTQTTIGKLLVNEAIPKDMRDEGRIMDKKGTHAFFEELAEKHPDKYMEVIDRMKDIARLTSTKILPTHQAINQVLAKILKISE